MTADYVLSAPGQHLWSTEFDNQLHLIGQRQRDVADEKTERNKTFVSKVAQGKYPEVLRRLFSKDKLRRGFEEALQVEEGWFHALWERASGEDHVEVVHAAFPSATLERVTVDPVFRGGLTVEDVVKKAKERRVKVIEVGGPGRRARDVAVRRIREALGGPQAEIRVADASSQESQSSRSSSLRVRLAPWNAGQVGCLARKLAETEPDSRRAASLRGVADWIEQHPDTFAGGLEPAWAYTWIALAADRRPLDESEARGRLTQSAWQSFAAADATGRLERLGEAFAVEVFKRAWIGAGTTSSHGWATFSDEARDQLVDASARAVAGAGRGADVQGLVNEVRSAKGRRLPAALESLSRALAAEPSVDVVDACVKGGLFVQVDQPGVRLWRPASDLLAAEWAARSGELPDTTRRPAALAEAASLAVVAALARAGLPAATLDAWLNEADDAFAFDVQLWRLQWAAWQRGDDVPEWLCRAWVDVLWAVAHGVGAPDLIQGTGVAAEILLRVSRRYRGHLPLIPDEVVEWVRPQVSEPVARLVAAWPRHRWWRLNDESVGHCIWTLTPWQDDLGARGRREAHAVVSSFKSDPDRCFWLLQEAARRGDHWADDVLHGRLDRFESGPKRTLWDLLPWRVRLDGLGADTGPLGVHVLREEIDRAVAVLRESWEQAVAPLVRVARRVPDDDLRRWCVDTLLLVHERPDAGTRGSVLVRVLRGLGSVGTLKEIAALSREWAAAVRFTRRSVLWQLESLGVPSDPDGDGSRYTYAPLLTGDPDPTFLLSELRRIDGWSEEAARHLHALGHPEALRGRRFARIARAIPLDAVTFAAKCRYVFGFAGSKGEPDVVYARLAEVAQRKARGEFSVAEPRHGGDHAVLGIPFRAVSWPLRHQGAARPEVVDGAHVVLAWAADPSQVPDSLVADRDGVAWWTEVLEEHDSQAAFRAAASLAEALDVAVLREGWLPGPDADSPSMRAVQQREDDLSWFDKAFEAVWTSAEERERHHLLREVPVYGRPPHDLHVKTARKDPTYADAVMERFGGHPRWLPVLEDALERASTASRRFGVARMIVGLDPGNARVLREIEAWGRAEVPFAGDTAEHARWLLDKVLASNEAWRSSAVENLWRALLALPVVGEPGKAVGPHALKEDEAARVRGLLALPATYDPPPALQRLRDALLAEGRADLLVRTWEAAAEEDPPALRRPNMIRDWLYRDWLDHAPVASLEREVRSAVARGVAPEADLLLAVLRRDHDRLGDAAAVHATLAEAPRELTWTPLMSVDPDEVVPRFRARCDLGLPIDVEARVLVEDLETLGFELPAVQVELRRMLMAVGSAAPAGDASGLSAGGDGSVLEPG